MAKLDYKFESILKLKIQIENQEQMTLGRFMQQLQLEEQRLQQLEAEEQRRIQEFYDKNGQAVKARALIELNQTIKYYHDQKNAQKLVVAEARKKVINQREVLTKAVIERKAYDKLKEKAVERYQEALKAEENKLVDEIVSYQHK